jgi:regulator of protease activity HflC (stomatin/prohibitin superfamily)
MFDVTTITIGLLLAVVLLVLLQGIQQVPDGKARVVERLGRRHRVLMPGLNLIIPLLDTVKRRGFQIETIQDNGSKRVSLVDRKGNISIAEHRIDPDTLKLLGKDNSEIYVNSVAYFKITDPMKATYDIDSLADSFLSLIETTLRQEVGKYDGDSIITSRELLGEQLRAALQEASTNWGVTVFRVEIEEIAFDTEVTDKLSEARKTELLRRAQVVAAQADADRAIVEAEARKKAAILDAEGAQAAVIKKAEGEKQAQILMAEASFEEQRLQAEAEFLLKSREQEGIAKGYKAIVDVLSDKSEAIIVLEALKTQANVAESLGKSNNTLIIPSEAAGLFGAVSAAIKGLNIGKDLGFDNGKNTTK